ncbi:IS110 family transposase [Sphingomonas sp. dw_22]|uniref:IS110 family transposase n=1 Tax=Sphingomonas sp. dw_22 TaxID=2721175 RepID=UPI001BD4A6B0
MKAIGLDISKSVFQVHANDANGALVMVKRLAREQLLPFFADLPPCLVGMETGPAAHHWAREITKLGHDARLMPAMFVKPFRTGEKTDSNDAKAICEALVRPQMRFIPTKSTDHQGVVALHSSRVLLIKQRTQIVNTLRSLFAEYGVVTKVGVVHVVRVAEQLGSSELAFIPSHARMVGLVLLDQYKVLAQQVEILEEALDRWHKQDDVSRRLATIPGVGLITASALAALTIDPARFATGRHFASWLGLAPSQNSSGPNVRMGRISRRGNGYLRRLLVTSALPKVRYAISKPAEGDPRTVEMLRRRPVKVVTVAAANRNARIAWALMTRGGTYDPEYSVKRARRAANDVAAPC